MVFTLAAILLITLSIIGNFKKAYLLYMLLEIFWFPNAKVVAINGLPSVPIYLLTSFSFFLIFFAKEWYKRSTPSFPLLVPFVFTTISRFLTCFTSISGFADELSRTIGYVFFSVLEVWLIWNVIESEKDFSFLYKGFAIIFGFASFYAVIEHIIQRNPIALMKSEMTPDGLSFYGYDPYRGYKLMSIFEHPIGAGINFGIFFIMTALVVFVYKKRYQRNAWMYLFIAALGVLCILWTKMRAGIFFLLISFFSVVNFKRQYTYRIIIISIIGLILVFPLYKNNINIFFSLFSAKARESVSGSSISMRFEQLYGVLDLMKRAPLTGLGERFSDYASEDVIAKVRALESVWFEEGARHGVCGIIGTAILGVFSVIITPYRYRSKEAFFIALAFWATYTLTSVPFVRMNLYYILYFFCIKNSKRYRIKRGNVIATKKIKSRVF